MLDFGLTPPQFRSQYLEQQPYVRTAALRERPMGWADIDELLYAIEPDEARVQLFNDGQIAPQNYIEERFEVGRRRSHLNKHRLYALLKNGATMVLNRLEQHSTVAKRLCADVGRFVGHPTSANAYVSFGGTGTFGKHWDTHDVFAVQLIGQKRWQVFKPTLPLPLSHQTSEQSQHSPPDVPVLDVVLATGDMLYVPRGWWHRVIPFDKGSLHISVGAYVPTWSDYIVWVCSRHMPNHLNARRGAFDLASSTSQLADVMRDLSKAMLSPQSFAEFIREAQMRERLSSNFDLALHLDQHGIANDAHIALTSHFKLDPECTEVFVNGGRLRLEPASRAIVRILASALAFTFEELCIKLPTLTRAAITAAVLDLARYEVLTVGA